MPPRLGHLVLSAVLCLSVLGVRADGPVTGASEYGQILVAEFELPAESLARFAAHVPSADDPKKSTLINGLLADTAGWVGPAQRMDPSTNPYTLVVTLTGTARADGDARSVWQAGWQLEDGMKKLSPFPPLAKAGARAGEALTLTRASAPTSFSSAKTVAPVLGLVRADNLDIGAVKVQLWAGIGNPRRTEMALSLHWLWVGLGMLLLFWWWRR